MYTYSFLYSILFGYKILKILIFNRGVSPSVLNINIRFYVKEDDGSEVVWLVVICILVGQ